MTQVPYSPMHGPEKQVSQEDMWKTLAKHSSPKIEVQSENIGQSPKAQHLVLQWQEPVRTGRLSGYLLTHCGTFSISKDIGKDDFVTYTAWRVSPKTELGIVATREAAELLCQAAP